MLVRVKVNDKVFVCPQCGQHYFRSNCVLYDTGVELRCVQCSAKQALCLSDTIQSVQVYDVGAANPCG